MPLVCEARIKAHPDNENQDSISGMGKKFSNEEQCWESRADTAPSKVDKRIGCVLVRSGANMEAQQS